MVKLLRWSWSLRYGLADDEVYICVRTGLQCIKHQNSCGGKEKASWSPTATAHVKGWNKHIYVFKNFLCPYLRNFTLYLTRHPVSLSLAHRGSGIWKQSCRPTVHYRSDECLVRWRSATSESLCWAASSSYHQTVRTHCDKDMHSWSRMAVFRAGISWLCQEWCCSLGSNFFPWVKVRNGWQPWLSAPLITGDFPSSSSTLTAHLDSTLAAFLFKILEFHYFRHNEALLKVCVDLPGSLWSLSSFLSQGGKREDKWIVLAKMDYSMQATRCLMRAIVLWASFKGVFSRGVFMPLSWFLDSFPLGCAPSGQPGHR